jgi:hypothetical protein
MSQPNVSRPCTCGSERTNSLARRLATSANTDQSAFRLSVVSRNSLVHPFGRFDLLWRTWNDARLRLRSSRGCNCDLEQKGKGNEGHVRQPRKRERDSTAPSALLLWPSSSIIVVSPISVARPPRGTVASCRGQAPRKTEGCWSALPSLQCKKLPFLRCEKGRLPVARA